MNAALIGIASGLIVIVGIALFKQLDKKIIYGLVLTAIGFLYVGYTWTDITAISINVVQAIFFLFLAYFGIKKNMYFIVAGYFLHGLWDLAYHLFADPGLIPPHYDMFCLSIDFTMGIYLWIIQYRSHFAVIDSPVQR
ncbi:MAG: hypothetical protein IPP15_23495 [Saprospiraceae bacterium]|uniref:Uncharacterized protein n=1 Tax=Candidatus Opimibacter skivensis TaxID=2982028 RepID=A0A9D7T0D4_9BACT|nr:hypothetical protein [Candidatus Opimibacter skivensis]